MVLTDFTKAAGIAARHCFQLAGRSEAEVLSLHVVSEQADLEWAEQKSRDQITQIPEFNPQIPFRPIALASNLFKGLDHWMQEQAIDLAFMATHGKKDLQFVIGSNALKLIYNTGVPTVVVQQHTDLRPYQHVLIPLVHLQSGMQLPVAVLNEIIGLYGSRITLLAPAAENDKAREAQQQTAEWLRSVLATDSIDIRTSTEHGRKFAGSVTDFADNEKVDLITVMIGAKHHPESAEKGKKFIQAMITNKPGVPVLCL